MNVTQRKYTVDRVNALLNMKINALLQENDICVKNNNTNHIVSFEEAEAAIKKYPELVTLQKSTSDYCKAYMYLNVTKIRELLNKPAKVLSYSNAGYINDGNHSLQQVLVVNGDKKTLLNEFVDRLHKLQVRAQYTKDQIMLADAKEALQALEEFNSLVF